MKALCGGSVLWIGFTLMTNDGSRSWNSQCGESELVLIGCGDSCGLQHVHVMLLVSSYKQSGRLHCMLEICHILAIHRTRSLSGSDTMAADTQHWTPLAESGSYTAQKNKGNTF